MLFGTVPTVVNLSGLYWRMRMKGVKDPEDIKEMRKRLKSITMEARRLERDIQTWEERYLQKQKFKQIERKPKRQL